MKTTVYNQRGEKNGTIMLPDAVFNSPWNGDLVHQVVVCMQANARTPVAHTKDRSEVRGGGKKPWQQKGTGRARHGSSRSPIWVGGGVTFGPRNEKDYTKKINKKMRIKALITVLSQKLRDKEIVFVDKITFDEPKTKNAKEVLNILGSIEGFDGIKNKQKNSAIIAFNTKDKIAEKSFNNFGNVRTGEVRNLNPVEILNYKYLIITEPQSAVEFLSSRISTNKQDK